MRPFTPRLGKTLATVLGTCGLAWSGLAPAGSGGMPGPDPGRATRTVSPTEPSEPARADELPALAAQVAERVRTDFFDPRRAEEWFARHRADAADAATDLPSLAARVRTALAELGASHTEFLTDQDWEYYALLSVFESFLGLDVWYDSVGADYLHADGRWFVRHVFAGGPAQAAGLRRGDEIAGAGGAPFDPIRSFAGRDGQPVTLAVRRSEHGAPFPVTVTPRRVRPRAEWLRAQVEGSRVIERAGKRFAYVPYFVGAGDEYRQAVQDAVQDRFQGADALILDLRDGPGGSSSDFVNLFNPAVAVVTTIGRDGRAQVSDPQWRKTLYLLINGGTRSGKEIVADTVRERRLGTLVGRRTAGAVLAGKVFVCSAHAVLYLAVRDALVNGRRLEGVGVAPDIAVDEHVPYCEGRDEVLEAALAATVSAR